MVDSLLFTAVPADRSRKKTVVLRIGMKRIRTWPFLKIHKQLVGCLGTSGIYIVYNVCTCKGILPFLDQRETNIF